MKYKLKEVEDADSRKEFIKLPYKLYKGHKVYVQPIDEDVEAVFNPEKNAFFKHGTLIRWILLDEQNETVGRVAAFIDENTRDVYEQPTGGMGFFECINNQEVAFLLFDACKQWLENRGIEAMDGPINFGTRQQWWGLHVGGEYRQVYGMFHHHPYYQAFYENYGFKEFFRQLTYRTELKKSSLNKIVLYKAKRVKRDKGYSTEFLSLKKIEKYIKDFTAIYNNTWVGEIPGAKEISEQEVRENFQIMKPLLEEKYMIFAYYNEKPIGFFIMIPDANEVIQHVRGKFNWLAKLHFLKYKYLQRNKTVIGQIFGVDRNYQGKGVEALLIEKFSEVIFPGKSPFKYLEFNWIGDFNPRMRHMMEEHLNAKVRKEHVTYRLLFDPTKPFKKAEKTQ